MKLKLMAIYDSAAKAFHAPFAVASTAIALRQLVRVMEEQPNHDFSKFGDQYVLFELGEWDNETGALTDLGQVSIGSLLVIRNRVVSVSKPSPARDALIARTEADFSQE